VNVLGDVNVSCLLDGRTPELKEASEVVAAAPAPIVSPTPEGPSG
jgi:hypothetical protein